MKDVMKRKVPDQEANLAALAEIKQNYFNIKRQTEAEQALESLNPKEMNIKVPYLWKYDNIVKSLPKQNLTKLNWIFD